MRIMLRWWTLYAALASAAMLGAAHAFEQFGGYAPCALCLKQREVYWFALVVAVPASLWALAFRSKGTPRLAAFLLFAIFTTGAITAGFHAGGELKWWELPATCGGSKPGAISIEDLTATITGAKTVRAVACDVAAWSFAGISMAGWNAIASALLALLSLLAARRKDSVRG